MEYSKKLLCQSMDKNKAFGKNNIPIWIKIFLSILMDIKKIKKFIKKTPMHILFQIFRKRVTSSLFDIKIITLYLIIYK